MVVQRQAPIAALLIFLLYLLRSRHTARARLEAENSSLVPQSFKYALGRYSGSKGKLVLNEPRRRLSVKRLTPAAVVARVVNELRGTPS